MSVEVVLDGKPLPDASATFDVLQPKASVSTVIGPTKLFQLPVVDNQGNITFPTVDMGLIEASSAADNTSPSGATFRQTVTPIPGHAGTFFWTQLVKVSDSFLLPHDSQWTAPEVQQGLDTGFKATQEADGSSDDAPHTSGISASLEKGYYRKDSFFTYLMFQSSKAGSIPVALRQVQWSWNGTVLAAAGKNGKWKLYGGSPKQTPPDQPASGEPEWTHIVSTKSLKKWRAYEVIN